MTKKMIKYLIVLLIIPLVVSLIISISGYRTKGPSDSFNSLDGTNNAHNYTYEEEIKSSNTFVYISIFTLIVISFGTWFYVKKKGEF